MVKNQVRYIERKMWVVFFKNRPKPVYTNEVIDGMRCYTAVTHPGRVKIPKF